MELKTNLASLEKLLSLGDIYCLEPTGNYSRLWVNHLEEAGKEVRLIAHDKLAHWRTTLNFSDKDDYHDAVAIAYYGAYNLNDLGAFNRVRIPELTKTYELFLSKERIIKELRILLNRSRNLLHTEFPECRNSRTENVSKIDKSSQIGVDNIWRFIAEDTTLTNRSKNIFQSKLSRSIGTAAKQGFTQELKLNATKINQLQLERSRIKNQFEQILNLDKFKIYHQVFNLFNFGTFEQMIILCQIYPLEQFLNKNGNPLKIKLKRKQTGKGNPKYKKIGLAKFHSFLGKAPHQVSSGNKHGLIVDGTNICRAHLYVWANREIVRNTNNHQNQTHIIQTLKQKYETDLGLTKQIEAITKASHAEIGEIKRKLLELKESEAKKSLLAILAEAQEAKKDPIKYFNREGVKVLNRWSKSRIADQAVKLLFKELVKAYNADK